MTENYDYSKRRGQFVVNVNVKVSNMFLIIGLGDGAKILEPESVVDEVKQITEKGTI